MFEFYKALTFNTEPPTLYSFMESIVNYGKEEKTKIKDLASASRSKVFNFEYPITSELKANFETTFLNHYMFRRINFDTFTSFQIHLQVKLQTIMPKYLKMLEGFNKLDFDGEREVHTKESGSTGSITSSGSDSTTTDNRYSNTPQNTLQDVQDGTYLTDYTFNQGNSSSESSSSSTSNLNETITIDKFDTIDEYIKFMKVANNVYELIFKECDPLFYGLV